MQQTTQSVRAGYDNKEGLRTTSVPIFQTTAYVFRDANHAANLFSLKELGNIYSRLTNPTVDIFEKRVAALENAAAAIATSSGQAAIFYAIANLAAAGDNIVISDKLYGGAVTLLTHTIKRFGIEARVFHIDENDLEEKIDANTKAIFFESLSNPQIAIAPIEEIVNVAKKHGVITVCDNTVATPIIFKPLDLGVDVVLHSASKYICGNGSTIAGVIAERDGLNEFFKTSSRYPQFNEPDESYHGLVYTQVPLPNFTLRIRLSLLRDIGASLSANSAWQLLQGLETLPLRVVQHSQNAQKIAAFLDTCSGVKNVSHPSLPNSKYHERGKKYFKNNLYSGLVSFDVESFEKAVEIINKTKIFDVVVNIGDSKSLITHPASTTHSQCSAQELAAVGVNPNTIRLSVGLEDPQDLIADLKQALA